MIYKPNQNGFYGIWAGVVSVAARRCASYLFFFIYNKYDIKMFTLCLKYVLEE